MQTKTNMRIQLKSILSSWLWFGLHQLNRIFVFLASLLYQLTTNLVCLLFGAGPGNLSSAYLSWPEAGTLQPLCSEFLRARGVNHKSRVP